VRGVPLCPRCDGRAYESSTAPRRYGVAADNGRQIASPVDTRLKLRRWPLQPVAGDVAAGYLLLKGERYLPPNDNEFTLARSRGSDNRFENALPAVSAPRTHEPRSPVVAPRRLASVSARQSTHLSDSVGEDIQPDGVVAIVNEVHIPEP
jgi:hypothetical protein